KVLSEEKLFDFGLWQAYAPVYCHCEGFAVIGVLTGDWDRCLPYLAARFCKEGTLMNRHRLFAFSGIDYPRDPARTNSVCMPRWAVVVVLLLLFAGRLEATAPIQQRTNPAAPPAADKLFSVVDLVSSPTADIGTGSIIDSHIDPATQIGYFCVL